jgi:hypothetical protein
MVKLKGSGASFPFPLYGRWFKEYGKESAWKRAAGVYVRILSQPQLYIEGNHRTGALIMSYILVRAGKAPFVLTVDHAKAYFDPSTLIKGTKKTATTMLMKLPHMKKLFADFLRHQTDEKYVYRNVTGTEDRLSGAGYTDT